MGHSRLCEYQANVVMADDPQREYMMGCKNVKEAQRWIAAGASVPGQAAFVKATLWPQTMKAKRFCAGRGDFIVVDKTGAQFGQIS